MPSASETMATAVTRGVLESVRNANVRLRIKSLDGPRHCGVYRLGRNARGLAASRPSRGMPARRRNVDARVLRTWSNAALSNRILLTQDYLEKRANRRRSKLLILLILWAWLVRSDSNQQPSG